MVKNIDTPNLAPSLSKNLEELKKLVPEGGDWLEILLEQTEVYDASDYYRENPMEAMGIMHTDLEAYLVEFKNVLEAELDSLDEEKIIQFKVLINNIVKNLTRERPVTLAYLFQVLSAYWERPKPKAPGKKAYRLRDRLLDGYDEKASFLRACGLREESSTGKGSHSGWIDPYGNMTGTNIISRNGRTHLRQEVINLVALGLPLERIKKACDDLDYEFEIKVDSGEE